MYYCKNNLRSIIISYNISYSKNVTKTFLINRRFIISVYKTEREKKRKKKLTLNLSDPP